MGADRLVLSLLALAPDRRLHLLDSCGVRSFGGRFLIAGFDPFETVEARGGLLRVRERGEASARVEEGSALSALDARLAGLRTSPAAGLPVAGACLASFSYDLARQFERLRTRPPSHVGDEPEPDACLAFFDTLVVHDYAAGRTCVVSVAGEARADAVASALESAPLAGPPAQVGREPCAAASNLSRDAYLSHVRTIKEHIYAGDIYQANLTQRLTCALAAAPSDEEIFLRLRRDHPAPFAAFMRRGPDVVISASPERFLRVGLGDGGGRTVEAWPVKGTRARGEAPEEDARLRAELLASEKDRAENVMIVDLARNDLGRVCRYGSVRVEELCALQENPTLFHLVSKVCGELRGGVTAGELLRATFPCGSITGATKLRAMEVIEGVEAAPRGLSMGALGYFSFDGRSDLSVAIRTMVLRGGVARFNVGGGVVADSDPRLEYEESLLKARALLAALGAELLEDPVVGLLHPEARVGLLRDAVLALDVEAEAAHTRVARGLALGVVVEPAVDAAPPVVGPDVDALNPPEEAVAPVAPLVGEHHRADRGGPALAGGVLGDDVEAVLRALEQVADAGREGLPRELQPFGLARHREVELDQRGRVLRRRPPYPDVHQRRSVVLRQRSLIQTGFELQPVPSLRQRGQDQK